MLKRSLHIIPTPSALTSKTSAFNSWLPSKFISAAGSLTVRARAQATCAHLTTGTRVVTAATVHDAGAGVHATGPAQKQGGVALNAAHTERADLTFGADRSARAAVVAVFLGIGASVGAGFEPGLASAGSGGAAGARVAGHTACTTVENVRLQVDALRSARAVWSYAATCPRRAGLRGRAGYVATAAVLGVGHGVDAAAAAIDATSGAYAHAAHAHAAGPTGVAAGPAMRRGDLGIVARAVAQRRAFGALAVDCRRGRAGGSGTRDDGTRVRRDRAGR